MPPLGRPATAGEIILEVAGNSPSRLVTIPNPHAAKGNGALTLSDTACGVGVYVASVDAPTKPPAGCGKLEVNCHRLLLSTAERVATTWLAVASSS